MSVTALPEPVVVPLLNDVSLVKKVEPLVRVIWCPDTDMSVTAFPLPVVVPLDNAVSDVNTVPKSTVPEVGVFVVPLILTPVTVPAFLVKPHPETVDSVTAEGISDVKAIVPVAAGNEIVFKLIPSGLYNIFPCL